MHISSPQWITHTYWQQKEHFLLSEDTYEDWVMFIIEDGSFRFRIGLHEGIGKAGDIIICPPLHRFCRETLSPLSFHFVLFGLDTPQDAQNLPDLPSGRITLAGSRERLSYNNEQLRKMTSLDSFPSPSYREHILLDTWYLILKQWSCQSEQIQQPPISPQMQQAADLLRSQALSGEDIQGVAHALGLTPVQLTRRFQAAFHVTPIRFVTSIRLHTACKLLADTDRTLDDIAQACGYENGFYLSRMFHKQMNLRPSVYRSKHRL